MNRKDVLALWNTVVLQSHAIEDPIYRFASLIEAELVTAVIEDEEKNPWKHAIMDAAVVHWTLEKDHEHDPRAAVNALICMAADQALDPSISEDARKLIAQAKREALEAELVMGAGEPVGWFDVYLESLDVPERIGTSYVQINPEDRDTNSIQLYLYPHPQKALDQDHEKVLLEAQEPVAECKDDGEGGVYYITLSNKAPIGKLYAVPHKYKPE